MHAAVHEARFDRGDGGRDERIVERSTSYTAATASSEASTSVPPSHFTRWPSRTPSVRIRAAQRSATSTARAASGGGSVPILTAARSPAATPASVVTWVSSRFSSHQSRQVPVPVAAR